MLISCKCLNFIATSNKNQPQQQHQNNNQQLQQQQQQKQLATGNGAALSSLTPTTPTMLTAMSADAPNSAFKQRPQLNTAVGNEYNNHSNNCNNGNGNMVSAELMHAFLQKYPRNFVFYSQCMDFFKEAIGPIANVSINAVNQRDLIYSLTLEVQQQAWQLSVCINCNVALCAKRLPAAPSSPLANNAAPHPEPPVYLINGALQTSNDELTHRRAERSFSDTFGVLIVDHTMGDHVMHSGNVTPTSLNGSNNMSTASTVFNIGSLNTMVSLPVFGATDPKQQRVRQLQLNLQQRLQREIAETDERIQRYSEQQFALLRSFREKSEQEFELLARLIQRVPENQLNGNNGNGVNGGLDRTPPALDVSEGVSYVARRRNTITSRRDLNNITTTTSNGATTTTANNNNSTIVGAPTTPISPYAPMNFNQVTMMTTTTTSSSSKTLSSSASITLSTAANNNSAMDINTTKTTTNINNTHNNNNNNGAITTASVTVIKANNNNRRMSNFDTPPATPEAMPMSVGSSPTFQQETPSVVQMKHQQQQLNQQQPKKGENIKLMTLPLLQTRFGGQQQQQPTNNHDDNNVDNENHDNDDDDDVDCLFEWDGDEMSSYNNNNNLNNYNNNNNTTLTPQSPIYQQQNSNQLYQRSMSIVSNQQDNTMSDLDESDGAEEAEDAIDLDSSEPITMHTDTRSSLISQDRMNFGKSLPIDIAGSPMIERNNYINTITHEEDLDCTLDIAASIKALAKSVHGEAVFGDLPRPRLRSQI